MKKFKFKKNKTKNTMSIILFIVFFLIVVLTILMLNLYTNWTSEKTNTLIKEKLDKIVYHLFTDLINEKIINNEEVNDLLNIVKNDKGEILSVDYNLEKTYQILKNVTNKLKSGINDLENGKIDVLVYDKYLSTSKNGLVLNIPLFLASDNIFINNIGPRIPVLINFNESILTNIKTKVTDYGLNNALLEIYITVEISELIITPISKSEDKFYYDILIGAKVINGSVPNFYSGTLETFSSILDIPI